LAAGVVEDNLDVGVDEVENSSVARLIKLQEAPAPVNTGAENGLERAWNTKHTNDHEIIPDRPKEGSYKFSYLLKHMIFKMCYFNAFLIFNTYNETV